MKIFASIDKRFFFLTTLVVLSSNQSFAQTINLAIYEDDFIKAKGLGASFDNGKVAHMNVLIENKNSKDLLLAIEFKKITGTSDSGESSFGDCQPQGLNRVYVTDQEPLHFSRLKPKGRVTISIACWGFTPAKTNSLGVNVPLVLRENDQNNQFILDLSDIPIRK